MASAAGPGTCRAGFHPVTTQFHHGVAAGRDANGNGFICIRSQRLGVFAVEDDQV